MHVNPAESSPGCGGSYLRVSVVVLLSEAVLDEDPLCLHSHALLYGHASVGQIRGLPCSCQPGEEEGSRIRESSR